MTPELSEHIQSAKIKIFRLSDGNMIMAEEKSREGWTITISDALQYVTVADSKGGTLPALSTWMLGKKVVQLNMSGVIAETDATVDEKVLFSRVTLRRALKAVLSPEEYAEAMKPFTSLTQTAKSVLNESGMIPPDSLKISKPVPPGTLPDITSSRAALN